MKVRILFGAGAFAVAFALPFLACVEPPPKINAIPASGLALRLHVFGASATEARQAFQAAKQTNKNFSLVKEGGDGEVLLGLENDSPKCVAPTALCSFKVAYRIKDNQGVVVHSASTSASANAERCADLCERALNTIVVKVIEAAAAALKHGPTTDDEGGLAATDAGTETEGGTDAGAQPASPASASTAAKPPAKKPAARPPKEEKKPEPARPEPALCIVGHGPHLPAEEAERRAAQVEALKRMSVLEQDEYDCLRKAYLDRL